MYHTLESCHGQALLLETNPIGTCCKDNSKPNAVFLRSGGDGVSRAVMRGRGRMTGRRVDLTPWLPLVERHPPPSPRGIIILKDKVLEKISS